MNNKIELGEIVWKEAKEITKEEGNDQPVQSQILQLVPEISFTFEE